MSLPVKKSLSGRRAVVIGGGIAGLSAGISLAARGARVVIVEEDAAIGPGLQPATLGGRRFDPWPPAINSPHLLAELFASADQRLTDFVSMTRLDPLCRFLLPGGTTVDFHSDPGAFAEEVAKVDARDAREIPRFLAHCLRLHESAEARKRGQILQLPWLELLHPRAARARIDARFRHPDVRGMFKSLRVLSHVNPFTARSPSNAQFGEFGGHGSWVMEGRTESLRKALMRLCQILGVRMVRRARVERIELHNGAVRRLAGPGLKDMAASIVVSTVPPAATIERFLPANDDMKRVAARMPALQPRQHRMELRAICSRSWEALRPITILPSADAREESRHIDRWRVAAASPSIAIAHAAEEGGCSIACHTLAPAPSRRYNWTPAHCQEQEDHIAQRLEDSGIAQFSLSVLDQQLIPPTAPAAEPRARHRFTDRATARLRPLSPRVSEVPGLYLACCSESGVSSIGAATLAGMLAAVCAAEDA